MNNFVLSYNPFLGVPSPGQLLNHLQINRYVAGYYQPFPGTYVIKSEQSAAFLTNSFKGLFENSPFVLSQMFSSLVGGTLPEDIWHWINHGYVPAATPAATLIANALTGRVEADD